MQEIADPKTIYWAAMAGEAAWWAVWVAAISAVVNAGVVVTAFVVPGLERKRTKEEARYETARVTLHAIGINERSLDKLNELIDDAQNVSTKLLAYEPVHYDTAAWARDLRVSVRRANTYLTHWIEEPALVWPLTAIEQVLEEAAATVDEMPTSREVLRSPLDFLEVEKEGGSVEGSEPIDFAERLQELRGYAEQLRWARRQLLHVKARVEAEIPKTLRDEIAASMRKPPAEQVPESSGHAATSGAPDAS
jgi:hypothetical protein